MPIFIIKESLINWNKIRPKNTFYFSNSAQNRAPILPDRAPILTNESVNSAPENRAPISPNRAPILTASANFNFSNFESLSQHL